MIAILNEIALLRSNNSIEVDYHNSNRYTLQLHEPNGTKTAYCFSTPIYNSATRKMVNLQFHTKDGMIYASGSNTNISISHEVRFENSEGYCCMGLTNAVSMNRGKEICCGNNRLYPTINGVAVKAYIKDKGEENFIIETGQPFVNVRANDKYFALMSSEFRPFFTVSCIGTLDSQGQLIAPARIDYQKISVGKYRLSATSLSPLGTYVLFEANMYEEKMIQDTTVESLSPKVNNAFGGTAFIGNTVAYGEQWLYSRPDFSKVPQLLDKHINRAVFHIPKHSKGSVSLTAFKVAARFCSFGSNWDNKIATANVISDSAGNGSYHSFDVTDLVTEQRTRYINRSEGLILKTSVKGSGFSAIATGDSYYSPQIFEINFR